MEDYFDRVEAQLGRLTKGGAHTGRSAGWARSRSRTRRGLGRARAAAPVLASVIVVVLIGALLLTTQSSRRPAGTGRPSVDTRPPPQPGPVHRDPGLVVPATYGTAACQNAAAPCNPQTPIPASMHRAMQSGLPKVGRQCRATGGRRISNGYVGGIALGGTPDAVRPLIGNWVDLRRRTIQLGKTATPGWGAIEVIWLAGPAYQGPFVIRAQPLDHSGSIRFGNGAPPPDRPVVVAAGQTLNSGAGYRTLPSSIWVRHPGCYGVQVDGLNFTSDFTVHVVAPPRRSR